MEEFLKLHENVKIRVIKDNQPEEPKPKQAKGKGAVKEPVRTPEKPRVITVMTEKLDERFYDLDTQTLE